MGREGVFFRTDEGTPTAPHTEYVFALMHKVAENRETGHAGSMSPCEGRRSPLLRALRVWGSAPSGFPLLPWASVPHLCSEPSGCDGLLGALYLGPTLLSLNNRHWTQAGVLLLGPLATLPDTNEPTSDLPALQLRECSPPFHRVWVSGTLCKHGFRCNQSETLCVSRQLPSDADPAGWWTPASTLRSDSFYPAGSYSSVHMPEPLL